MKKILILLLLILSLGDCKAKKNKGLPLILWNSALTGDLGAILDANGNDLPGFEDIPEQTVATRGALSLVAKVESQECFRDEVPIPCREEEFDYSTVQYQLVNALNSEIATGTLNSDGSLSLQSELENGNYRLLLIDNPDLNWDHFDFKYTYNPTKENREQITLRPKRKYYFGGPGEISGEVFGDAYTTIDGSTLWPSAPLANTKVDLKCKDSDPFSTYSNANGKFIFRSGFKNGNCSISVDGSELSLFNSPYGKRTQSFRWTFIGKNLNIPTALNIGKISLSWHPADTGNLSINWRLKGLYGADLSDFRIAILNNDGDTVSWTYADRDGNFSFDKSLEKGDYLIKITQQNFLDSSIALSFEPNWDGSTRTISQTKIPEMIPKPMTIAVPNGFRVTLVPQNTYMELVRSNSILDPLWNATAMNPVTLIPIDGKISIPAGKWNYFYSSSGYKNSDTYSIINNGNIATLVLNSNVTLTPSIYRTELNGSLRLGNIDTSNGVYIALSGMKDNNGEELVLIAKTTGGSFSFSENIVAVKKSSYCPTYPQCPNLQIVNLTSGDITSSIYFANGKLLIPEGNYNWNIIDPVGTYTGNGTVAITENSAWGAVNQINISLNTPITRSASGVLSDTFSMSALNGATVTFGRGEPWTPLLVESTPIVDRNTTSGLLPVIVTTNPNGGWSANGLPNGTWIIKITKEGYDPIYQTITVPQTTPAISSLVASGGKGNLSGRIILPGGFIFKEAFTLEVISAMSGARPSSPQPPELKAGTTSFSNTSSYKLYNIDSGIWKMTFKSANYETIICWVNIGPGENNYDVLTAVQGGQPPFPISGNLYNATNNRGIATPLTLTLRPGVGNTTGSLATRIDGSPYPVSVSSADSTFFLPDVPAGVYTLSVTGSNWAPINTTVVSSAGIDRYSLFVSPIIPNDEIRIVLSWNSTPKDLDSHLEYGDAACLDGGKRCQVLWNDISRLNGDLTLDVDVTTGLGPETITGKGSLWTKPRIGYTIYNWSDETTFSNSGATVRLFKNNTSRSWSVPTNVIGRWWNVFCLNNSGVPQEVGSTGCLSTDFWNVDQ